MTSKLIRTQIQTLCMAALLGLAACSQDEWPGGQESFDGGIVFTSPYSLTRSSEMRYGAFKDGDQVGVLGFCEADNDGRDVSTSPWDTKKVFCAPDVFYNQLLTYNAKENIWSYEWNGLTNARRWSDIENATYAFFAYYPYAQEWEGNSNGLTIPPHGSTEMSIHRGSIILSEETATGDPTITYTMPFASSQTTDANTPLDWTRVPDLMLAYSIDHVKADGAVKLNFRHLFCAFEFRVNNYNTNEVKIKGLYVSGEGFYRSVSVTGQESGYTVLDDPSNLYSGRFDIISNYNGEEFTCPAGKEVMDGEGNVVEIQPYTVSITTDGSTGPDGDPVDLLFIPDENGKLTANGYESPSVTLTVDGIQKDATMNLKEATFRPGVRSIFNINIVGNDIYLQVESDGTWEDGGDSDISFD